MSSADSSEHCSICFILFKFQTITLSALRTRQPATRSYIFLQNRESGSVATRGQKDILRPRVSCFKLTARWTRSIVLSLANIYTVHGIRKACGHMAGTDQACLNISLLWFVQSPPRLASRGRQSLGSGTAWPQLQHPAREAWPAAGNSAGKLFTPDMGVYENRGR